MLFINNSVIQLDLLIPSVMNNRKMVWRFCDLGLHCRDRENE